MLPEVDEPSATPTIWQLFVAFLTLGSTAFGGPAIVACMRDLAVTRKRWLSDAAFRQGVALCQAIPGATAMQCAAYIGLRVRGITGALITYVGFGLPAFALMLFASASYARTLAHPGIRAVFLGLQLAVVAIVANATLSFGKTSLKTVRHWVIAIGSTVLLAFLRVNPLIAIAAASLAGLLLIPVDTRESPNHGRFAWGSVLVRIGQFLLAGCCIVAGLAAASPALARLCLTMMRVDVFAFGGGFSSLPLMFDEFVGKAALSPKTFIDGVALGQVTPGPVVITATFFGYQLQGVLGAVAATLGIFFPSFTLVVTLAPGFERLLRNGRFQAATHGASLCFVGLLVAVTFRFARAISWTAPGALAVIASVVALRLGLGVLWVLAGSVLVQADWTALLGR